jgi:hypothetical protein
MKLFQDTCLHNNYSPVSVSKCLTKSCQECTGSYIPSIDGLHDEIICACSCHQKERGVRQIGKIRTSPTSFDNHPNGDLQDDYR